MPITREHELHKRRMGRNTGVGLALLAFIVIVFGLTVAKVKVIDVPGSYQATQSGGAQ